MMLRTLVMSGLLAVAPAAMVSSVPAAAQASNPHQCADTAEKKAKRSMFGSLLGRHQFVPHISPKKTWEGIAGSMFASLVAAFGLSWLIPAKLPAQRNPPK